jgi:hypothetical protein
VSLRQTNLVCYKLLTEEHDKNVQHLFVSRFYRPFFFFSLAQSLQASSYVERRPRERRRQERRRRR